MLDAYIIEQIRRREQERREQRERPRLELPLYHDAPPPEEVPDDDAEPARVIIIDL